MSEVRTTPSAFPALGHDVGIDYCTHSMDLLAQKLEFFVLTSSGHSFRESNKCTGGVNVKSDARAGTLENVAFPSGIAMLLVWLVGMVLMNPAPGWLHFFLIFGVFMVMWGIVVRGDRGDRTSNKTP